MENLSGSDSGDEALFREGDKSLRAYTLAPLTMLALVSAYSNIKLVIQ